MYKRFSVEVIQEQKRSHTLMLSRLSKVAVIFKIPLLMIFLFQRKCFCVVTLTD